MISFDLLGYDTKQREKITYYFYIVVQQNI
jgi:hypothetical protein